MADVDDEAMDGEREVNDHGCGHVTALDPLRLFARRTRHRRLGSGSNGIDTWWQPGGNPRLRRLSIDRLEGLCGNLGSQSAEGGVDGQILEDVKSIPLWSSPVKRKRCGKNGKWLLGNKRSCRTEQSNRSQGWRQGGRTCRGLHVALACSKTPARVARRMTMTTTLLQTSPAPPTGPVSGSLRSEGRQADVVPSRELPRTTEPSRTWSSTKTRMEFPSFETGYSRPFSSNPFAPPACNASPDRQRPPCHGSLASRLRWWARTVCVGKSASSAPCFAA